jgi:hypothetical protein
MMLHEFYLLVALPNETDDPTDFVDRLYEAGCNDCLLGVGRQGFVAIDASREADTRDQAIESVQADIRKAIPDARSIALSDRMFGGLP